mgnify:FL=1
MTFEVKLSYTKLLETGQHKKVCEGFLVSADSYGEAEQKMLHYAELFMFEEPTIKSIRESSLLYIFQCSSDCPCFEASISIITLDERTGREKSKSARVLVQTFDMEQAKHLLQVSMNDLLIDYHLTAIKESRIADLIDIDSAPDL